ncbi:MAG TPA: hypothetical protein VF353_05195, partial [Candidatus Binatia bacterium]
MSWDLSSYFPEFNGPEMRRFKDGLARDIASLKAEAAALPPLITESAASWERILLRNEDILQRISHLGSYIGCLASSDARNESYLKEEAALVGMRAELGKLKIEFLRAIKETEEETFSTFLARPALDGAQNYLNRMRQEAQRAMTPEKEILATDLSVDGIQAWGRLYDTMASKLEFDMLIPH